MQFLELMSYCSDCVNIIMFFIRSQHLFHYEKLTSLDFSTKPFLMSFPYFTFPIVENKDGVRRRHEENKKCAAVKFFSHQF